MSSTTTLLIDSSRVPLQILGSPGYGAPGPDTADAIAAFAASDGASRIGFLDDGIGAAATTVEAFLREINQKRSGNFYEPGAKIQRLRDRVFMGSAADNNATNFGTQPDWFTTQQLTTSRTFGFQQGAQAAVLTENSPYSANAFFAGARTSPFTTGGNAIGAISVALNNNSSFACQAYGGYDEAWLEPGALGGATGREIEIINRKADGPLIDPFNQDGTQTIGLQLASGGDVTGVFKASAAINIRKNGAAYRRGIVFGSNSIDGADGITGTALAISFAKGHGIGWYSNGSNVQTSAIYSTAVTPANSAFMNLGENSVTLTNKVSNKLIFSAVNPGSTTVNYPRFTASDSGAPVLAEAAGDDANIDFLLRGKGTGVLRFGTYTALGSLTVIGYIPIKDDGGTTRRIAIV